LSGSEWGGCVNTPGTFTIERADYDGAGRLEALNMGFRKECGSYMGNYEGTIAWGRDDPARPPGPVWPVTPGLWSPRLALPAHGDYLYLVSDHEDEFVGRGREFLYTGADLWLVGFNVQGALRVMTKDRMWNAELQPTEGVRLARGLYANVEQAPSGNPARGGLALHGDGRMCPSVSGWFAIDELELDPAGQLVHVKARFVQYCSGMRDTWMYAFRGQLVWTRPTPHL
jgi:hypothetical protein